MGLHADALVGIAKGLPLHERALGVDPLQTPVRRPHVSVLRFGDFKVTRVTKQDGAAFFDRLAVERPARPSGS
jgi:hypothetical protein